MNRLQKIVDSYYEVKSSWDDVFLRNMKFESDENVTNNPYKKNDMVYICISTTAKAISQVPVTMMKLNSDGEWEPDPTNPWQAVFGRPNYLADIYTFIESIVGFLMLDGNVWIVPFPPGLAVPQSLWTVRKANMSKIVDPNGTLAGWTYKPGKEKGIPLSYDEVSHVKFWNPDDPIMGQAPLEAGKLPLVSDYKAAKYNDTFFDHGAVPDGVLSTDKTLTNPVFERILQQFESRHGGYKKGHRVAILEQGLKYTQSALAQKDMEFSEGRKFSAERLMQIFGMKKAILGMTEDVNRATAFVQRKEWWEGTNVPIMKLISSAINFTCFSKTPNMKMMFDVSNVEGLHEEFNLKVEMADKLTKMGYTGNEVNARLQLGFDEKPWRDYWYAPVNVMPISESGGTEPGLEHQEESLAKTEPFKLVGPVKSEREIKLESNWNAFIKTVDPLEEQFEKKIKTLFFKMRKKALEAFYKKSVDDILDAELFAAEKEWLRSTAGRILTTAVKIGGTSIINEIGMFASFNLDDPIVVHFLLEKSSKKVVGIIDTVVRQLQKEISTGYEIGESVDQIADRIRGIFNTSTGRAKTIARTEVVGASNFGRAVQIEKSGFEKREWFTAMDERVRPSHQAMHGEKVNIGEAWTLSSGASLRYPGDYTGPPGEIINCRCVEVVVEKEE